MLLVKKLLEKVLDYINSDRIRYMEYTGTSNGDGALPLYGVIPKEYMILSVCSKTNVNIFGIPFKYNDNTWYAKMVYWQNLTKSANTQHKVIIYYIIRGGTA